MSELQIASRRDELARHAVAAADSILRSATAVKIHSVHYNVRVESNEVQLLVAVDGATSAMFDRRFGQIDLLATDPLEVRKCRQEIVEALLGTSLPNPRKFTVGLVTLWTGPIEGTVRPNTRNQPVGTKSAAKRPALRR